jgi:putative tryptophan/tyrosine transport system substrate-binding protein
MSRHTLVSIVALGLALCAAVTWAQQPDRMRVVGVVTVTLTNNPIVDGFHDAMHTLGYVEGRNIRIENRGAEGHMDRLPQLARELAERKADVIVAFNTRAARAAMEATTNPVVFLSGDPVNFGLARNLSSPSSNATGISIITTELTSKRLELLHLVAPRARRLAFLSDFANPPGSLEIQEAQRTAQTLGVQLVKVEARNPGEIEPALTALTRSSVQAVLVGSTPLLYANRAQLAAALRTSKVPAVFPWRDAHDVGVLMSYGVGLRDAGRKVATYVDKILKGAKPADLPIEQISKYELVIDLRVAKELDLKVPQELLQRADEVIR